MKILHINTTEKTGGAARAANWLHTGLQYSGVDSAMLVQQTTGNGKTLYSKQGGLELLSKEIRWILDYLPIMLYKNRVTTHWSTGWVPNSLRKIVQSISPDIIHLHWICRGFLSISELGGLCSLNKPVLWTLHDSWPFTGGCHVPGSCLNYSSGCGNCPQLGSKNKKDLSSFTLNRKKRCWSKHDITIVTPSNWLAGCAADSALFADNHIEVIANGIDTGIYSPVEKEAARTILLPNKNRKKKILCGAVNAHGDPNKGFKLLYQAIEQLSKTGWKDKIELIVFGESETMNSQPLPVNTQYIGHLHDDTTLRLAYSTADVFVIPSLQENLPNSILEALACGTPVVGFNAGGIPEIIEHNTNGYLVKPFDIDDLAKGIEHCLIAGLKGTLPDRFTQAYCTNQYITLYENLLKAHPSNAGK